MAEPKNYENRVIIWLKNLARLMGLRELEAARALDYAEIVLERFDADLLDSRAMRAVAARSQYFPNPRELTTALVDIQRERQAGKGATTQRTPDRVAWAKKILAAPERFSADAVRVARTVLTPEENAEIIHKSERTLDGIQKTYAQAWHAITNEVLRTLAEDIDKAAAALEEGDRAHFRGLVTSEVQSLCSPLAQAVAQGRERPPMDYARLDLAALARRTESQLHSVAGYEGRKNLSWWERRYGPQVAAVESVPERKPAPEMVWSNPNSGWDNPNK